jgi:hypothetical protein
MLPSPSRLICCTLSPYEALGAAFLGTPHINAEVFLTGVTGNITAQPPA